MNQNRVSTLVIRLIFLRMLSSDVVDADTLIPTSGRVFEYTIKKVLFRYGGRDYRSV